MIKFTSSDLNRNPAKVLAAAREAPVLIQVKRTNGEVAEEFVLRHNKDLFVFGPITTETIDSKGFRKVVKEHHNPDYTTTTLYNPNGEWIGHTDTRGSFMAKPGDSNDYSR